MNRPRPGLRFGGAVIVTALVATLVGVVLAVSAAPASAAVPGLERVSVNGVSDSNPFKQVTVSCPAGKQVVGAEYSISGGVGSIVLDDLVVGQTTVRVGAREDANGTTSNWSVRASAMCANRLPGYEIVQANSASSSQAKSVVAFCPSGKQLVGSGVFLNGGLGEVVVDALLPSAGNVVATAFEGDNGGTANSWNVNVQAICANPLPGHQIVFATSATSSVGKLQDVVCPAGKQVLSAGFDIFGGLGEVTATGMFTSLFDRTASVGALEDDNGTAAAWSARAFGVCATP